MGLRGINWSGIYNDSFTEGVIKMTLDEAMECEVTRAQAVAEISLHDGADLDEFFAEYGFHATYEGADVLGWLGY